MKESTHKLMTLDFWRICIANFLLYAAVWMLLPILPAQYYLMGLNTQEISVSFLLFVGGMIGVGPLHAFLGDAFKRKYVLLLFTLAVALCFSGWLTASVVWQVMLLMLLEWKVMLRVWKSVVWKAEQKDWQKAELKAF